jgi:hypothetical protein
MCEFLANYVRTDKRGDLFLLTDTFTLWANPHAIRCAVRFMREFFRFMREPTASERSSPSLTVQSRGFGSSKNGEYFVLISCPVKSSRTI